MPVGMAALPPNLRALLWVYFRIKKPADDEASGHISCNFYL